MNPLEKNFKLRGFVYNLEWRSGGFAIYSQWFNDELIGYESFKIRKNKSYERFGKTYEECESYPTDKSWGREGFTSKTFKEAKEILLKHFPKIQNLMLEPRTEPRTPLKAYHNTPKQNLIGTEV